ncbi:MAG TPA: endonuclease domain-containing protein [Bacteroidota bacterium]|nr:endonuclease domain-containing protein [Bacteroidota bacterium]
MTKIYNRSSQREQRKSLRNHMPSAEVIVWSRLQKKQLLGCKFRRQFSIGHYIVDFYSTELKLVIEIDGDSHFTTGEEANDRLRQSFIEQHGIRFLRFTNVDVYKNLSAVMQSIYEMIEGLRKEKSSFALLTLCVQQQDASPLTKGDKNIRTF